MEEARATPPRRSARSLDAGSREGFDSLATSVTPYVTDRDLLTLALTHRSYCAEVPGTSSNERLEFLGDAVLGLVVTAHLYESLPLLPEGDLARIRAAVVSSAALAPLAAELGIGAALLLGKGEEHSGGRNKTSLLADALEAVIGAVYLSSGPAAAQRFVLALLADAIETEAARSELGDAKNRLQELAARLGHPAPTYTLDELGPDHAKRFVAVVAVGGVSGRGEGRSKKEAERVAAEMAVTGLSTAGA
jgi:ribonuclease-3